METFPEVSEVTERCPGPVVIPGFDICYLEPLSRTIDFRDFPVPSTPKRLVLAEIANPLQFCDG